MKKALLLIDLQNDFMPGGPLGVKSAHGIIPLVNHLQREFDFIVATQDWHPADHRSFASNHPGKNPGDIIDLQGVQQILWPDHCIQHSLGAEFVTDLETHRLQKIIQKGTDPWIDSYSGFFDNRQDHATGLHAFLTCHQITHLTLAGIATDYCVKYTALDAIRLGYEVTLSLDACRAVNLQPDDGAQAVSALRAAGVHLA